MKYTQKFATVVGLLSALLGSQAAIADNWCPSIYSSLVRVRPSTSTTITNGAGWVLIASRAVGWQGLDELWEISASLNATASTAGTFELGVGVNGTVVSYWTSRVSGSGYVNISLNTSELVTPATRTIGLFARAAGADLNIRPGSTNGIENASLLLTRHHLPHQPGPWVLDCQ